MTRRLPSPAVRSLARALFATTSMAAALFLLWPALGPAAAIGASLRSGGGQGGIVHGRLQTSLGNRVIEIPDVLVTLEDSGTMGVVASATSARDGAFLLTRQPAGTYWLRAEAEGFEALAGPIPVVVSDVDVYLDPIELTPRPGVVHGTVSLPDGSPTFYDIPMFDVSVDSVVSVHGPNELLVAGPVRANEQGEYVIGGVRRGLRGAGLPGGQALSVHAWMGATSAKEKVVVGAPTEVDLVLPNSRPDIVMLTASRNGEGIKRASPGDAVTVEAETFDADGDVLTHSWITRTSNGPFVGSDSPTVDWNVPLTDSWGFMYLLVTDGSAYRLQRLRLRVTDLPARFTGIVRNPAGVPIAGAQVRVDGAAVQTDSGGYFDLATDVSQRHALTISRFGFETLSEIVYGEIKSQEYVLRPALVFPGLDPSQEIVVGGDGDLPRVVIPPGSLVGPNGEQPAPPVRLALTTIDPFDAQGGLPGDRTGTDNSGALVRLEGLGALGVDLVDASGTQLDLAPGALAWIELPVPPPAAQPVPMPVWHYGEAAGVWSREPQVALLNQATGRYEFTVSHFSTYMLDPGFFDSTCVRVVLNERLECLLPVTVAVTVHSGALGYSYSKLLEDPVSVVTNLPPLTEVSVELLGVPGSAASVTTGPGFVPGIPVYPYYCGSALELLGSDPDVDRFLYFIENDEPTAGDYYLAIDPNRAKTTLDEWKSENGFDALTATTTAFFNRGDLCFGRRMTMFQNDDGTFYFVTNYASVADAVSQTAPIATVAMEYSAHPDGVDPYTKFYVFNADGVRIPAADLDGLGERAIPGLCLVCHKGDGFNADNLTGDLGAKFLAFDLESFEYSGQALWTRFAQRFALREQNRAVLDTDPTPTVQELIEGWYGGPTLPDFFDDSWVPDGWDDSAAEQELYEEGFKANCRMCHSTRTERVSFGSFDYLADSDPSYNVCRAKKMPHALVPYLNFWMDPDALPAFQNGALGTSSDTCYFDEE